MAYTKYSLTPANNTAAPPDGAPEGMLPSAVNDTMRDMMAQIRDCGDGIRDGTYTMTTPKITGGTITGAAFTGNTFTSPVISGGTINNATIGATTATTGKFTTLEATGVATFSAGTVSAPAITTTGDTNTGIFFPAADTIAFTEGGVESMRITSAGDVLIGTTGGSLFSSNRFQRINSASGKASSEVSVFEGADNHRIEMFVNDTTGILGLNTGSSTGSYGGISFLIEDTERMRIDRAGNVGIGTSSPSGRLQVETSGSAANLFVRSDISTSALASRVLLGNSAGTARLTMGLLGGGGEVGFFGSEGSFPIYFQTNGTERMRITSGGNVGIGTTSPAATLDVGSSVARSGAAQNNIYADYRITAATTGVVSSLASRIVGIGGSTYTIPDVAVYKADPTVAQTGVTITNAYGLYIGNMADPTSGGTVTNSWGVYQTASANQNYFKGTVFVGRTSDTDVAGITLNNDGFIRANRDSASIMVINRNIDDGDLVVFRQAGATEGSISVSGSTVSYNGGHLSRWSQWQNQTGKPEVYRGSVLESTNDMCEWNQDNEQATKTIISSTVKSKAVAGVFDMYDTDDKDNPYDFYVAQSGDFVIRIAQGVVVENGDLLESAGDGTAKPQTDDICRSSTVAKVTSNYVSTTYADGSYCVPCILMIG